MKEDHFFSEPEGAFPGSGGTGASYNDIYYDDDTYEDDVYEDGAYSGPSYDGAPAASVPETAMPSRGAVYESITYDDDTYEDDTYEDDVYEDGAYGDDEYDGGPSGSSAYGGSVFSDDADDDEGYDGRPLSELFIPVNDSDDDEYFDLTAPDVSAGRRSGRGRKGGSSGRRGKRSGGSSGGFKLSARAAAILRRLVVFAVLEVIVLFGIRSYAKILKQYNKIQRPDFSVSVVENKELSSEVLQMMKGYWNIAVFGVDGRDMSVGRGNNSDVIMIVSINQETGEIRLVSVFRDTYLSLANSKSGGNDSYSKINAAYAIGGPELAVKAINKNLDLNITEYATFNWASVATAINILGGVDLELSGPEFYYINSFITETVKETGIASFQLEHAGMNHLDGIQAVAYARLRYMDNDYARTERQRKIIQLCYQKAMQAGPEKIMEVAGVTLSMVATNLTWQDAMNAAAQVRSYHIGETGGFPFARGEQNMGKRGSCVIPQTLETNVRDLHKFLFGVENYACSDTVLKISRKISEDSGMYKEGRYIDHVGTDNGYIPTTAAKKKETAAETKAETSAEETNTEEEESTAADGTLKPKGLVYETDADGNVTGVFGTDADGERVSYEFETAPDGSVIIDMPESDEEMTDENGDPIETKETRPTGPRTPGDIISGGLHPSRPGSRPGTSETDPMESAAASTEGQEDGESSESSGSPRTGPGARRTTESGETTTAGDLPAGPGAVGPGGSSSVSPTGRTASEPTAMTTTQAVGPGGAAVQSAEALPTTD